MESLVVASTCRLAHYLRTSRLDTGPPASFLSPSFCHLPHNIFAAISFARAHEISGQYHVIWMSAQHLLLTSMTTQRSRKPLSSCSKKNPFASPSLTSSTVTIMHRMFDMVYSNFLSDNVRVVTGKRYWCRFVRARGNVDQWKSLIFEN